MLPDDKRKELLKELNKQNKDGKLDESGVDILNETIKEFLASPKDKQNKPLKQASKIASITSEQILARLIRRFQNVLWVDVSMFYVQSLEPLARLRLVSSVRTASVCIHACVYIYICIHVTYTYAYV